MKLKIAILQNYLDNIGGAEKVGLTLAREFNAPIYSTNINFDAIKKQGFNLIPKSIGKVPLNPPFRQQLTNVRFRNLNLKDKFDHFIISGDWNISAAIKNSPSTWYAHSPIRELWDLRSFTRNKLPAWQKPIFSSWSAINRRINLKQVSKINNIVANSVNVQSRIKTYLKKDSTIINPPIETKFFKTGPYKNYWLSVNRLTSHKRIEMQIRAFRNLPDENLIIVGSYEESDYFKGYVDYIKRIAPNNVTILHQVKSNDLIKLYSECKGYITTAMNEDFGMTPIEAMASGKAVIAPNEGGFKETIVNGETGFLIDDINSLKLAAKIKSESSSLENFKKACLKQSKKFSVNNFMSKIKKEIGY